MAAGKERDYILGTHDEEIERLGLQHRVWRPRAADAWKRAGFTTGQTLIDIGCGPGYASMDLAEIVGPAGRVVAIDRSRRFLDALGVMAAGRALTNLETHELDLDEGNLPEVAADGAWTRWVFAFVKRPKDLLARVTRLLKPGATFVIHEYFDYSIWRTAPRTPELEEFVSLVMKSWRATGGEPDIGLDLPVWLGEMGYELKSVQPIVEVAPRSSLVWEWPRTFIQVGLERLVGLGLITDDRALVMKNKIAEAEKRAGTLMITPGVLEIVALRK